MRDYLGQMRFIGAGIPKLRPVETLAPSVREHGRIVHTMYAENGVEKGSRAGHAVGNDYVQ